MVALAWPDLLPDVLSSYQLDDDDIATISRYSKDLASSAGGFKEEQYDISDVMGDPTKPMMRR